MGCCTDRLSTGPRSRDYKQRATGPRAAGAFAAPLLACLLLFILGMAAAACVCRAGGSAGATIVRRLMAGAAPTDTAGIAGLAAYAPGGEERSFSRFGRGAARFDRRAVGAVGSWAGIAAAAPALPGHPFGCRSNLMVVLTSHKTGTAQARCITELIEQRYQPPGASNHSHMPEDAHDVARFAAQPLEGSSKDAGPWCPPFKLYSAGHHLPLLEDEGCPGELPCPCTSDQSHCLTLAVGTLDIPSGNTTVVQVIREPAEAVLSAYLYHTQAPTPERWLEEKTMAVASEGLQGIGVPYESLVEVGAFSAPNASLYHFMRSLAPEKGVKLQYWLSAWDVFGFARQYASLVRQRRFLRFLPIRFEDLQQQYNATATALLEAVRERLPPLDVPAMLDRVQVCHVSSWDPKDVATHQHITTHRNPSLRAALRQVLFSDPLMARQLCELSALFGYSEVPECAAAKSEAEDSSQAVAAAAAAGAAVGGA